MSDGTVNIHGKEYKTVALRMKEFREEYPLWGIETEIVTIDPENVVVKALIKDDSGRVVATGHAEEWKASSHINKTSYVENAETSAVGRALAFFKYAGSEIASADEIEIAKRKEEALQKTPKQQTDKHWTETPEDVDKFWEYAETKYNMNKAEVLAFLNVETIADYTGTKGEADKILKENKKEK